MVLTAALSELGTPADEPQTIAETSRRRLALTGEKVERPAGAHRGRRSSCRRASVEDIGALPRARRSATGITLERQETMNHEPQFVMKLDGVQVERRGAHR